METTKTLLALVPLLFTSPVFANQCNDNAPLADPENIQNGYFSLDGNPITAGDQARMEKLATKLQGHWQGVELVKECVGHFSNPTEAMQNYKVRAEITRHDTGAIRVQAEKERQSDRVFKLDTMFISPETDTENGRIQGWHTLDFIGENTVIFSHKSRVANGATQNGNALLALFPNGPLENTTSSEIAALAPNASGTSRMLHEVKKIDLQDNRLTVDRKLYVNGYFVEQNGWILER